MSVIKRKRKVLLVFLMLLSCYAMVSIMFLDVKVFLVSEHSFFIKKINKYVYHSSKNRIHSYRTPNEETTTASNSHYDDERSGDYHSSKSRIHSYRAQNKETTASNNDYNSEGSGDYHSSKDRIHSYRAQNEETTASNNDYNNGRSGDHTTSSHDEKKNVFKCPVLEIKRQHAVPEFNLSCQPHVPSPSGCKYAENLYVYNSTFNTCKKQSSINNICSKSMDGTFKCSFEPCGKDFDGDVLIHSFDESHGSTDVSVSEGKSVKDLERIVYMTASATVKRGYNFLFLSCGEDKTKGQLLPLTPQDYSSSTPPPAMTQNININLFNYDSVSRAHFYRSLKKSIQTMNTINSNTDVYNGAEVLDFELFQSIHGHSQENSYAMMTGRVFPKNISMEDREETPTKIQEFYKFLKEHDYDTFYQDDMCTWSGYGLRRDFGALGTEFEEYKARLNESYIDDYGLTFANCKMIKDVFDGDTATFNMNSDQSVCYNGRPNDAYLLDYNLKKFQNTEAQKRNLFSFNNLQFAHDAIGFNIQTMDETVSDFIYSSTLLNNTLTIILADHGNSYTSFTSYEMEGRYEQYHPSLFMIIPKGVRNMLGGKELDAMRLNQKRMLTMVDIHDGIHHIVDSSYNKKGFLEAVPENRTCKTVELGKPNLCVCEGSESPAENKTEFIGQIEFAVGKMNNLIYNNSKEGRCKRIVPQLFQNALQRSQDDGVILSFDLLAQPGHGSANKEERFSFEVYYKDSESSKHSFNMRLRMSSRISKYGLYNKVCSDAPTTFRLCICDMVGLNRTNNNTFFKTFSDLLSSRSSQYYDISRFSDCNVTVKEWYVESHESEVALYIREYTSLEEEIKEGEDERRTYIHTVTFEVLHLGVTKNHYKAEVEFSDLSNMKPVSEEPCQGIIKPKSILYLCTIQRKNRQMAEYEYSFSLNKV